MCNCGCKQCQEQRPAVTMRSYGNVYLHEDLLIPPHPRDYPGVAGNRDRFYPKADVENYYLGLTTGPRPYVLDAAMPIHQGYYEGIDHDPVQGT